MAISDYNSTPGLNTAISGINVAEGCAPGNVNDAIRQMMADLKTYDATTLPAAYQAKDADLTAIAGLTSAADRVPYYTGAGTAALATFTAAGRALVDDADAAAQRTTLGATATGSSLFTAANAAAARTAIGATATGSSLITAADAAAARTAIGAGIGLTLGTAVASTSGTSIDFTGIPSTARRVTLMLAGVSTSGTSNLVCQIGAGSFLATGYVSQYGFGSTFASSTTSFGLANSIAGTSLLHGAVTLDLIGSNLWVARSMFITASNVVFVGSGSVTLGGALDRIRLTTVGGTDTFDAGTVNISNE